MITDHRVITTIKVCMWLMVMKKSLDVKQLFTDIINADLKSVL